MKVLLIGHEREGWRELDLESGAFTVPENPPVLDRDPVKSLYPDEARGRWQKLGETVFCLYRVGIRLHFRAGSDDVELGPDVALEVVEGDPHNEVIVRREGAVLWKHRYPSQQYRRVDSFIDPWEEDDDLDLVLYASDVANDAGRRKRIFATPDEIALGEVTPEEEIRGAIAAVAAAFPRERFLELRREILRWTWRWQPANRDGWGPDCSLCGRSAVSRFVVRVSEGPSFAVGTPHQNAPAGVCAWCLSESLAMLREPPVRGDAALADVVRALRARGGPHDETIASRLTERFSSAGPDAVVRDGTGACSLCGKSKQPVCVRGPGLGMCETCVRSAREVWRPYMDALVRGPGTVPSRWEAEGYFFLLDGPRRLHLWAVPLPERPLEFLSRELTHWDPPFDDVAIGASEQVRLRATVEDLARKSLGTSVVFRD